MFLTKHIMQTKIRGHTIEESNAVIDTFISPAITHVSDGCTASSGQQVLAQTGHLRVLLSSSVQIRGLPHVSNEHFKHGMSFARAHTHTQCYVAKATISNVSDHLEKLL